MKRYLTISFVIFSLISGTMVAKSEPVATAEQPVAVAEQQKQAPSTDVVSAEKMTSEQQKQETALLLDNLFAASTTGSLLSLYDKLQDKNIVAELGMTQEEIDSLLDHLPQLIAKRHAASHFNVISSYLDEMAMIIKRHSLSISTTQQANILATIKELRSRIHQYQPLLSSYKAKDIRALIAFNEQVIPFLIEALEAEFKTKPIFKNKPTTRSVSLSVESIREKVAFDKQQLEKLGTLFIDLGVTKWQKTMHAIGAWNQRHNVLGKFKLTTFGLVFFSLLRYFFKSRDDLDRATRDSDHAWLPGGLRTAANFLDNRVVGRPPIREEQQRVVQEQQRRYFVTADGSGVGVCGQVERRIGPFLTFIAFATLFKQKIVDAFADNMNLWQAFYKNTTKSFRIGELFKHEKSNIDSVEEMFLTKIIEIKKPTITFDDVIGLEDQKKELQAIIQYLIDPSAYDRKGTAVEKGYLFYGPTRTGKTYLAEALAGEVFYKYNKSLTFLKINSAELRVWGIKKAIEVIRRYAPCVVFIDEIDLLNLQRGNNTTLLEEFLTSLSACEHDRIVFLAATNRVDHLDNALLQPGRFGRVLSFENPSVFARQEFFERQLQQRGISINSINAAELADRTEGCSFGHLASIVNDALTNSTQTRKMLSQQHFVDAIDRFKYKIVDTIIDLPPEEQKLISIHLAGQALACHLLPTGHILNKVTMLPIQKNIREKQAWMDGSGSALTKKITSYGDVFVLHRPNSAGIDTPQEKINQAKMFLAGHAAQRVIFGSSSYDYKKQDMAKAHRLVGSMVYKGLKKDQLSKSARDQKSDEILGLLEQYTQEVETLLQGNMPQLELIATVLRQRYTLTADEIRFLIDHAGTIDSK